LEEFKDFNTIKLVLVQHPEKLIAEFDRYIPDKDLSSQHWTRNPFEAEVGDPCEDIQRLHEGLLDLKNKERWCRFTRECHWAPLAHGQNRKRQSLALKP